jgi:hypothetical protein
MVNKRGEPKTFIFYLRIVIEYKVLRSIFDTGMFIFIQCIYFLFFIINIIIFFNLLETSIFFLCDKACQ